MPIGMFIPRTKSKRIVYGLLKHCNTVFVESCFSTSCVWTSRKKQSQYGMVDTERYSSLVKAVVSSRVSSQTPESLEDEDNKLYGPVVKSSFHKHMPLVPKNVYPLLKAEKTMLSAEYDHGNPARWSLPKGPERSGMPSVTRILQQTMSPEQLFYLERWKRKMIAELGEEGFKAYTSNLFKQGKLFHSALENALAPSESEEPECTEDTTGYLESIQHVLEDINEVRAIESAVQHQHLNYVGIVDCVARYRGTLCAIDWKTSEKSKPFLHNTYDNPIQVAAYVGALNSDDNYSYQIKNGLIVVAYKDGSPAHPHFLDFEKVTKYWEKWLLRLELYKK
ncbi:mitochondrial genome maintenance exonuclease 1-like [Alosa pseudoharengus]|uniref:mitochondrial genome maintenance exonuclease 1-like n=1 Tax=Alosa pseudoharengus TaxID=34774 RepID=UPI003F8C3D62